MMPKSRIHFNQNFQEVCIISADGQVPCILKNKGDNYLKSITISGHWAKRPTKSLPTHQIHACGGTVLTVVLTLSVKNRINSTVFKL